MFGPADSLEAVGPWSARGSPPPGWDTHGPFSGNCFRLSARHMTGNHLPLYSALYSGRYSAQHDAPSSTSACLQYV